MNDLSHYDRVNSGFFPRSTDDNISLEDVTSHTPRSLTVQKRNECNEEIDQRIQTEGIKISKAYAKFLNRDRSGLREAENAYQIMERLSLQRFNHSKDEYAKMLMKELKEWKKFIQEMRVEKLTRQDVENVAAFVTPPSEKKYVDSQHNEIYYQPNHSQLLSIGSHYFSLGKFQEMGLLRRQRLINPETFQEQNCDILYFKKEEQQIKWEMNHHYKDHFPKKNAVVSTMNAIWEDFAALEYAFAHRAEIQEKIMVTRIIPLLAKYSEWEYASFLVADSRRLAEVLKYDWKNAIQSYAIIFYHKKCEKEV